MPMSKPAQVPVRNIVIGRNSRLWRMMQTDLRVPAGPFFAIGHAEVEDFAFQPGDRLWILSYSRDMADNMVLFDALSKAADTDIVYISTATANIDALTTCYDYPRIKRECERLVRQKLAAHIVSIGVVHVQEVDLPGGTTIATSVTELIDFMLAPVFPTTGELVRLFRVVDRPFSGFHEKAAFRIYGILQRASGSYPCLLRPLDLVLRALGWRWYGYVYLSNRLWLTTTS